MARKWHGSNWINRAKRLAIYDRDGFACAYCKNSVEDGYELSLDHLEPVVRGGANEASNLVTACRKCNSVRGDRDWKAFAKDVAVYLRVPAYVLIDFIAETKERPLNMDRAREILAARNNNMVQGD